MSKELLYKPGCMRTFSGQMIEVANPDPLQLYAIDIAVGLSRECRFGGHTKRFYSVAEHAMWCADRALELFPDKKYIAFKLLMHDAHEAYLKDIPSPVKSLIPAYEYLRANWDKAIELRFGLTPFHYHEEEIKAIDREALEWEFEHKFLNHHGIELPDHTRIDLFIQYFTKLCPVPHCLMP